MLALAKLLQSTHIFAMWAFGHMLSFDADPATGSQMNEF